MISVRSIIFYLIVVDLSLMPMFHVFGLPYKPGFLLVGSFFVFTWYRKQTLGLLGLFFGLIASCWLGAIYQKALYEVASSNFTIYCTVSYLLCFIGYSYSYYYSPRKIDNIIYIAIAVLFANVMVGLFFADIPMLVYFYNLQEEVAAGWVSRRNPGIFENPNISSLGINLLLLFIVLASYKNLLTKDKNKYIIFLFICAFVVLLTLGSKGELIAFLILAAFFLKNIGFFNFLDRKRNVHLITIFFLGGVFFFVCSQLASRYPESSFRNGFYFATNGITELYGEYVIKDLNMESRGDRRVKYLLALKAFSYSPLWGSGFDRAERGIFSKESKIGYHSDWSYLLVAGGIFALFFFLLILFRLWRTHPLLVLPFFIPGLTNSFMLAPQFFCLFGVFWGVLERHRINEKQRDFLMFEKSLEMIGRGEDVRDSISASETHYR